MNRKSSLKAYLLRIDFSKKVIFILGICIFAAFILVSTVLLTYHDLTNLLEKQISGLEYHKKIMSINEVVLQFQDALYKISSEKKASLESQLETANVQLLSIVNGLESYIRKREREYSTFYLKLIKDSYENFYSELRALQSDNKELSMYDLRRLLTNMENHLMSFLDIINNIFNLQLYTNKNTGIQLTLILNDLPSYQYYLGQLLSLNVDSFSAKDQEETLIYQTLVDQNLKRISNLSQFTLENEMDAKTTETLAQFLTLATHFSHSLSSTIHHGSVLKNSWQELQAIGTQVIYQSHELYDQFFQKLKISLSEELYHYYRRIVISSLLFILGTLAVLIPYLAKVFRRPLTELKTAIEKLTAGDLSVRIPILYTDEVDKVSKSFNETAEVFEYIMHEADSFANQLSQYSSEIFSKAKRLEENLGNKEKHIQAITQNSKDIFKNVRDFSYSLDEVSNTIDYTVKQVNLSRESLGELEIIMQQMVASANHTVAALSTIKSEIAKITQVINTLVLIADQINLLSLNTAIRASKTGVQKLGFAVIADKICELADQTAYATLDMEHNVQQTLSVVPEIVHDIDQFGQEINGALEDSISVWEQFKQLLMITQTQIVSFQTINKGMQDQEEKTADIDKTIYDLIISSKKTTTSVRSLYIEIEYLYNSIKNLQDMTSRYMESSK